MGVWIHHSTRRVFARPRPPRGAFLVSPPLHVYSSPLRRARETAEAIARNSGAPTSRDDDLIDLDYGAWSGLTPEEAERRDPEAFALYLKDPERAFPPDGEPLAAVADRILKQLQRMAETFPGQTVAAVSHEVPIRLLVARVAGLTGPDLWDLLLPTGAVVRVAVPVFLRVRQLVRVGAGGNPPPPPSGQS